MLTVVRTLEVNDVAVVPWLEAWLSACTANAGRPPEDLGPWLPWDDGRGAPGRVSRVSAAPTCRYAGRDFTEDEIALIRDLIAEDPKLTRAHLSRAFCRRVGWVKPDGGLRDMMARCGLLAMHRDGLIVLPPPRRPRHAPRPSSSGRRANHRCRRRPRPSRRCGLPMLHKFFT